MSPRKTLIDQVDQDHLKRPKSRGKLKISSRPSTTKQRKQPQRHFTEERKAKLMENSDYEILKKREKKLHENRNKILTVRSYKSPRKSRTFVTEATRHNERKYSVSHAKFGSIGARDENLPAVMFYEKVNNGNYRPINAMTLVPARMLLGNNPDANDSAVISQQNARKLVQTLQSRHTDKRIENLK